MGAIISERDSIVGAVFENRRSQLGQIVFHTGQNIEKLVALALADATQQIVLELTLSRMHLLEQMIRAGREVNALYSTVDLVSAADNPAAGFEAVYQAPKRDFPDIQKPSEFRLHHAVMPRNMGKNPPLRTCDAQRPHKAIKSVSPQSGHVVDKKTKSCVRGLAVIRARFRRFSRGTFCMSFGAFHLLGPGWGHFLDQSNWSVLAI
jgi:hypothetical protein